MKKIYLFISLDEEIGLSDATDFASKKKLDVEILYNSNWQDFSNLDLSKGIVFSSSLCTVRSRKEFLNIFKGVADVIAVVNTVKTNSCYDSIIKYKTPIKRSSKNFNYYSFEIPFKEEGFKDVILYGHSNYSPFINICPKHNKTKRIEDFDENIFLSEAHPSRVYKLISDTGCNDKELLLASLLHDYGKNYTTSVDTTNNIKHYYSHENVGTFEILTRNIVKINQKRLLNVLFYINYHELAKKFEKSAYTLSYKQIFGEKKFNNLHLLSTANIIANER